MSAVQNGVDAVVVVVESEHEIVPYRVRKALAVDRRKKIKTIQGKKSIFLKILNNVLNVCVDFRYAACTGSASGVVGVVSVGVHTET